ncbi:MAG: hypothetical protein GF404_13865 [candidate division Zixibacteria bacterium]|nr:hypothetical protein [candidate division Zixibacteria bacterium]
MKRNICGELITFRRSAVDNMQLDRNLLKIVGSGENNSYWRIYSWEPPAISLGKNQTPAKVLCLDTVERDGIDFVMRPTGGRAIFHKGDICISCAAPLESGQSGTAGSLQIYEDFADLLVGFFDNLNIKVNLARGTRLAPSLRSGIGKLPCFLSATPYELVADGKKIAGIAMFVGRDRYLVQSSLRVQPADLDDFRYFLGLRSSHELLDSLTSVVEMTGSLPSEDQMQDAFETALKSRKCDRIRQIEAPLLEE